MGYLPDAMIQAFRRSVNLGLYFNLQTTPELRLWGGLGDIEQELPAAEIGSFVYKSARLENIPEIEIIMNGGAERASFTIEGVSDASQAAMAELDPPVLGKELFIGIAAHDADWQPASDIWPLTVAMGDYWAMARTRAREDETPRQTITLNTVLGDVSRSRPVRMTYADRFQRLLFPGDEFCKDTPRYHRGYVIAWPRF